MALLRAGSAREPLYVGWMAAALITAAFLGAALGLVWQSTGWGDEPAAEDATAETAAQD